MSNVFFKSTIFSTMGCLLILGGVFGENSYALSSFPTINFERKVIVDEPRAQPVPFANSVLTSPLIIQEALLKRNFEQLESSVRQELDTEKWLDLKVFRHSGARILNYTAKKDSYFLRGIYISEDEKNSWICSSGRIEFIFATEPVYISNGKLFANYNG